MPIQAQSFYRINHPALRRAWHPRALTDILEYPQWQTYPSRCPIRHWDRIWYWYFRWSVRMLWKHSQHYVYTFTLDWPYLSLLVT